MRYLLLPLTRRYVTFASALVATILLLPLSFSDPLYWFPFGLASMLAALGTHDLLQTRHSLLRNYPIVGHIRFLFNTLPRAIPTVSHLAAANGRWPMSGLR